MAINITYKIIYIVLVCIIIFLIYTGYGYMEVNVEPFAIPSLDTSIIANPTLQADENSQLYTGVLNAYINNENKKLNNLYYDAKSNLDDAIKLLKKKNNYDMAVTNDNNEYPAGKTIKTIKSIYNSQYLTTTNNDINKYGVIVNDKCLTVAGLCPGEFCLEKCQDGIYSSNSQKFTTDRIMSNIDAAKIMNIDMDSINDTADYPYNIFRSGVNNKCLTMSNSGVSVEPCNLNNPGQRWKISPDANLCKLE